VLWHVIKIAQFWWNLVHYSTFRTWWQSHDQIWKFLKFKMADAAILKIVGHNSSAECPISVKFCVGNQFFTEYQQWEIYSHVAQNSFLVFIMQFRLQQVGLFVSSPIRKELKLTLYLPKFDLYKSVKSWWGTVKAGTVLVCYTYTCRWNVCGWWWLRPLQVRVI